jgi:ribosome biogenesis GTPase
VTGRAGAGPGWLTVARVDFGGCVLIGEDGEPVAATVRGRLRGPSKALGNAVVVGDRVRVGHERERTVVEEVAPRRNAFSRRAAGPRALEQVVAVDLDQVVLVAALADPPFRAGLADRVLSQAEHAGIPARLVLNKTDLGSRAEATAILADYERAGYPGHLTCARSGDGLPALRHACEARRSLFIGHSGVGKSTLLNALEPAFELLVGKVNDKTGKGRHTTTAAVLLRLPDGLELIDTPGVRAFAPWGIGARDLEQSYVEFRRFLGSCRFGDCGHVSEPGCALRAAVERGEVPARRYESFLKLREELVAEAPEPAARSGGRRG